MVFGPIKHDDTLITASGSVNPQLLPARHAPVDRDPPSWGEENELTIPVKQRQNWRMKILATRILLAAALNGVLVGMMPVLKPAGLGNP